MGKLSPLMGVNGFRGPANLMGLGQLNLNGGMPWRPKERRGKLRIDTYLAYWDCKGEALDEGLYHGFNELPIVYSIRSEMHREL